MEWQTNVTVINTRLALVSFIAFMLGSPFLAFVGKSAPLSVVAGLLMLGGIIGFTQVTKRSTQRSVRVSAEGLSIDGGNTTIASAAITEALYIPAITGKARSTNVVQVKTKGKMYSLDVSNAAHGNEALRALGQDVSARAFKMGGVSARGSKSAKAMRYTLLLAAMMLPLAIALKFPILIGVAFLMTIAGSVFFVKNEIHVGADGVLIKNRFESNLTRYEDVVAVNETARGASLSLRDGRVVAINIASGFAGVPTSQKNEQQALIARINAAWGAKMDASPGDIAPAAANVAWRLERDDKTSFSDWVSRLVGEGAGETFRQAGLRTEDLIAIATDHAGHHAKISARVGAALLLAKHGGDEGREHIRVAAEATASPKLRVVFETIGAGDEVKAEDLEEAIRDAEDEMKTSISP